MPKACASPSAVWRITCSCHRWSGCKHTPLREHSPAGQMNAQVSLHEYRAALASGHPLLAYLSIILDVSSAGSSSSGSING